MQYRTKRKGLSVALALAMGLGAVNSYADTTKEAELEARIAELESQLKLQTP